MSVRSRCARLDPKRRFTVVHARFPGGGRRNGRGPIIEVYGTLASQKLTLLGHRIFAIREPSQKLEFSGCEPPQRVLGTLEILPGISGCQNRCPPQARRAAVLQ